MSAGPTGERGDRVRRFPSAAGRHAGARHQSAARRDLITAVDLPARGLRQELHLSEAARPPVLRLRAGLGRGGARDRRRHDQRRRASRWAASPTSRGATRRRRHCCAGKPADAEQLRARAADLMLRDAQATSTTTSRSSWRAAPSSARCRRPPQARRSRRPTSASSEAAMVATQLDGNDPMSARRAAASTAAPRSPAPPNMPPSSPPPTSPMATSSSVDHRQGPHHRASTLAAARGGARRHQGLHAREPAAHGLARRQNYQDQVGAPRLAVPAALR